jgi:hypothetical protein
MTYAATIAEGWETIRTDKPLAEIAQEQAASRVLSPATRDYFRYLLEEIDPGPDNVPTDADREAAFFEAAASFSTRKGQSYARRVALGDLARLRLAVVEGKPIPRARYYATGLPATVVVHPDGRVEVTVDLTEAAAAVADSDQPGAVEDSATVAAAVYRGPAFVDLHTA